MTSCCHGNWVSDSADQNALRCAHCMHHCCGGFYVAACPGMDISVKLCCSLRWLSGILLESPAQLAEVKNLDRQALSNLLLEPYHDGMLKNGLILSLTNPSLYIGAYEVLFPGQHVKNRSFENRSFEPLIHSLARKGGYVLEDDTNIVTSSMLAQEAPFREKSHLALLDVLMVQYASKHITMHKIIKTVRRLSISTFNASKELPSQIEADSLLTLWLNKVSEGVRVKLGEEMNRLIHDPDPRQRRRNKAAMMETSGKLTTPLIRGNLYRGIHDGQIFAALLLHYAPHACTWNDFNLSDQPLSHDQVLRNLQFFGDYCSTHLPAPGFHLHPNELIEWGQSGLLDANIIALLAHLFYCFETRSLISIQKSNCLGTQSPGLTSSSSSVVRPPTQNQSRASLHCASSGSFAKPSPRAGMWLKPSLQSQSAGALLVPPSHKSSGTKPGPTQIHDPQRENISSISSSCNSQIQAVKLDSNSRTSLLSFESNNSRTFKAPLRTSLTSFQSKALAAFGKDKHLLTKGALSQSSPLLRVQAAPAPRSPPSNELISMSTDNLHIQKQLRNAQTRSRGSVARQRNPLEASHKLDSIISKQSGNSTDVRITSVDTPDSGGSGDHARCYDEALPVSSAIPVSTDLESSSPVQQEVRGSFTLDKQHTYASASAAGLPIINNREKLADCVRTIPPLPAVAVTAPSSGQTRTNSKAMMLTNLLQLHEGGSTYTIAARKQPIPTDVKELRVNLRSFIASLHSESVHMEREARIQRLKLYQPKSAEALGGDRLSSVSVVIEGTTPSTSEPVVAQSKAMDVDLIASISLPSLHNARGTMHLQRDPVSSLEQFERDEFLVRLQTSPENLVQSGTVGHETQGTATACAETTHQPRSAYAEAARSTDPSLQELPLSPIASNGQVFVEQTPDHHYSTEEHTGVEVEVPTNPWMKPINQEPSQLMQKLKKKEELIRNRIEERDRVRRIAAEHRAEVRKEEQTEQKNRQRKGKRKPDVVNQHHTHGLADIPNRQAHADPEADTIHFQLSAHHHHHTPPNQGAEQPVLEHAPELVLEPATVHAYNGPGCYVKPKVKSNVKIIRNAICAVCLAGEVNLTLKQKTLYELENATASHVVILFRDTIGFKFRGIYSYNPGDRYIVRIYGTGPKEVSEFMISHIYKYNSGQKEFKEIPSRSLSVSVDGLTIKGEYWHTAKRKTVRVI